MKLINGDFEELFNTEIDERAPVYWTGRSTITHEQIFCSDRETYN